MRLIFKVLNPLIIILLHSPIHFILSKRIMVLTFYGHKSGKKYRTPLSYLKVEEDILCVTSLENVWWRNLVDESKVLVTIKGKTLEAAGLAVKDFDEVKNGLVNILNHNSIDSYFAKVRLIDGIPNMQDIEKAAPIHVLIKIKLQS